ncbi:MAG: UDP-N-acetylmuramoyl-L-alanyl-D-glutamate--2,6-diaminopimelate ligase [Proteocatella sp.]
MKKTINQIIELLKENQLIIESVIDEKNENKEITSLTDNSKEALEGTLFVCKGAHFKKDYLEDAIKNGAICYITDNRELADKKQNSILVNDIRKTMAILGNFYYENAWENFKLIGITGTKGKSTTAYFLKSIIDNYAASVYEKPAGILSSIENYDGTIFEESHLTTPEPLKLHWHFNNMKNNHIKYCIMEVSSQALKYDRVLGVNFDVGCFLNIGEDHISDIEHNSFEDYFSSKAKLFDLSKHMIISDEINFDEIGVDLKKYDSKTEKFGDNPRSQNIVKSIVKNEDNIEFEIQNSIGTNKYKITLGGIFNVYNAAAAISVAVKLNIPYQNIYDGLASAKVSGRMEMFYNKPKHLTAIVDYAHNKLSFEKLFESVKEEYPDKKIVSIFGCPGGKAFSRRQFLGEIAGANSDLVIITEEDAGEEPLEKICSEIESFVKVKQPNCKVILDREDAIREGLSFYNKDTVVLITGKGRETRQKRGTDYIETLSDVEIVEKYI